MRVCWFSLESLTAAIGRASVDGSITKTIAKITGAELIDVDDVGMPPCGQDAAKAAVVPILTCSGNSVTGSSSYCVTGCGGAFTG